MLTPPPTPTPTTAPPSDRTAELDRLFLLQYHDVTKEPKVPLPLASPEQMLQGVAMIVAAILMGKLPELTAEVRAQMTGQLTPGVRELVLAAVLLLTDHPDIAKEAGFGPEVFEHIARSDVELENLGSTFNDLVISLTLAEGGQQAALLAFNSHTLLVVQQMLDELNTPEHREAHDVLLGKFRAAMNKQAELTDQRSQNNSGKDPNARPSQKVLKEQLSEVAKDANVRHAVATIQATARNLDQSGTPPLLPEKDQAAAKGRGKGKGQ